MSVETEIQKLVRDINGAWLEKRPDDLSLFFHPRIVMVPLDLAGGIAGAEAP